MEFGGSGVAEEGGAGEVEEMDEAAEAAAERRYRRAIQISLLFGLLAGSARIARALKSRRLAASF